MSENPAQLRYRANLMRRQAVALDSSLLRGVALRADEQTWIGPTASAFRSALRDIMSEVAEARSSLHLAARRLEHRAEAIEAERRRLAALAPTPS